MASLKFIFSKESTSSSVSFNLKISSSRFISGKKEIESVSVIVSAIPLKLVPFGKNF